MYFSSQFEPKQYYSNTLLFMCHEPSHGALLFPREDIYCSYTFTYFGKSLACMPRIASRCVVNGVPWSGFIKKSAIMCGIVEDSHLLALDVISDKEIFNLDMS